MKKVLNYVFVLVLVLGLLPGLTQANSIDFVGGFGGAVSYDGLGGALVGTDLPVVSVYGIPPGSPFYAVNNGLMNFTTGPFSSSTGVVGNFTDVFLPGGTIIITGGVPNAGIADGSALLSGTFSTGTQFSYFGFGLASMTGGLIDVSINNSLFTLFGFTPPYLLGLIVQADLQTTFPDGTAAPGAKFDAMQASANIVATTPEPASLLLLGAGLVGLGFLGRRRFRATRGNQ